MSGNEMDTGQFQISCAGFTITCTRDGLPRIYASLKAHAELVEEFDIHERNLCCVTVRRVGEAWPCLVVAQSHTPYGAGFDPSALLVPETKVFFLGAGERILAYRLEPLTKIWEDRADTGVHGWERYGDTVLLAAELEFAAWTITGRKLWTMFVEPPWDYSVTGDRIKLNVMGNKQLFGLREGPPDS